MIGSTAVPRRSWPKDEEPTMRTHDEAVQQQFDPQANAFLTSPVHAQGPDLQAAKALVAGAIPSSGQAIDLGCGAGHLSFALAPHLSKVIAVDPSPNMLATVTREATARGLPQIGVKQASAESLPFADGQFDLACTRYSTHHWRHLPQALRNAQRILKPTGYILVIDLLGHEDPLVDTHLQTLEVLRDPSHVRSRSTKEWTTFLQDAGFSLIEHRSWPVRIVFDAWIERIRTPPERASLIRAFQ